MPKYLKKVTYYKKPRQEQEELAPWTKIQKHENWLYYHNLRKIIQEIEDKFFNTRNPKYIIQQEHLEELKQKLLYEGKNVQTIKPIDLVELYRTGSRSTPVLINETNTTSSQQNTTQVGTSLPNDILKETPRPTINQNTNGQITPTQNRPYQRSVSSSLPTQGSLQDQ